MRKKYEHKRIKSKAKLTA